MKFYSLASSSKGNCYYISNKNEGILIDAGITLKDMLSLLSLAQIKIETIKAIFITHEHYDHIKGLKQINKLLNVPIYGSYGTLQELLNKDLIGHDIKLYEINKKPAYLDELKIEAFHTSHDSAESLGYAISTNDKKISICTDLGYVVEGGFKEIEDSDLLLLESNYDENMLINGIYPYNLKKRIMSKLGHLSNKDCSNYIKKLIKKNVNNFILGHLSQNNNLPQLALQNVISELQSEKIIYKKDYMVDVAPVKSHGKVYDI